MAFHTLRIARAETAACANAADTRPALRHGLRLAVIALLILPRAWCQEAGVVPAAVVRQAYQEVQPAIGLVEYTSEVTNPATGNITRRNGNCLGLVVAPGGLLMTFGHLVLENSEPIRVRVTLGQTGGHEQVYTGTVLGKPDDLNVTFIQLQSERPLRLPYVRFQPSMLRLNDPVALVGILGSTLDNVPGVLQRRIGAVLDKPRTTYCIDEPVVFGYVGGPVIDHAGRLVGVVGFDLSPEEGGDLYVRSGQPLVYQAQLFQKHIANPPTKNVDRDSDGGGWLGILSQPLTDDLALYWDLPQHGGVVVSTVVPGSPAEEAGFQTGDVITRFAGTDLRIKLDREIRGFTQLVRESAVGLPLTVDLLRNNSPAQLQVTLRTQPKTRREASELESELFGVTVRELTTDMRLLLNLPETINGVIVRRVRSGSPAQIAGLRAGVIILNFGDHPIVSLEDFENALSDLADAKPTEVSVLALSPTGRQFYRLEPRW
jgi:serine protease Do